MMRKMRRRQVLGLLGQNMEDGVVQKYSGMTSCKTDLRAQNHRFS